MAAKPEPMEAQVTIQIDVRGHWRNDQNPEDRFNLYIGEDYYLNAEEIRELRDMLDAALEAHELATRILAASLTSKNEPSPERTAPGEQAG